MLLKWTIAGVIFVSSLSFPARAARVQGGEHFALRTVRGTVLNSDTVPVRSAIVYLYDDRTQSVKTYIADNTGHYRFSGLYGFDDYEIHAEFAGMTSKSHPISSQDDQKEFVINLRISRRD